MTPEIIFGSSVMSLSKGIPVLLKGDHSKDNSEVNLLKALNFMYVDLVSAGGEYQSGL